MWSLSSSFISSSGSPSLLRQKTIPSLRTKFILYFFFANTILRLKHSTRCAPKRVLKTVEQTVERGGKIPATPTPRTIGRKSGRNSGLCRRTPLLGGSSYVLVHLLPRYVGSSCSRWYFYGLAATSSQQDNR